MRYWGVMLGLLLLGLLASSAALCAEEAKTEPTGGTVTGVLVKKAEAWIEVQAEGEKTAQRYIPYWRGGLPKDGGGPDKATVAAIKTLVAPNLVKLTWALEENHRRIVTVEMIAPKEKAGTVVGIVTAKGENWLEVKPDGTATERYTPRWIGGMPKDGGGLDKEVLRRIAEVTVGDKVELTWTYDERKRVTGVTVVAKATK